MTTQFQGALDAITQVRGVRGAMVVAQDDGLVVADTLMENVSGSAVAALTSSLFKRIAEVMGSADLGPPRFVQFQASAGLLLVLPADDDVLLVAVAEPKANVGLVRLEMLRAVGAVA